MYKALIKEIVEKSLFYAGPLTVEHMNFVRNKLTPILGDIFSKLYSGLIIPEPLKLEDMEKFEIDTQGLIDQINNMRVLQSYQIKRYNKLLNKYRKLEQSK